MPSSFFSFRDLRGSVRFRTETAHLEEDLVGVMCLNLAVFSCKPGGERERLNRAFEAAGARRLRRTPQKHLRLALFPRFTAPKGAQGVLPANQMAS